MLKQSAIENLPVNLRAIYFIMCRVIEVAYDDLVFLVENELEEFRGPRTGHYMIRIKDYYRFFMGKQFEAWADIIELDMTGEQMFNKAFLEGVEKNGRNKIQRKNSKCIE